MKHIKSAILIIMILAACSDERNNNHHKIGASPLLSEIDTIIMGKDTMWFITTVKPHIRKYDEDTLLKEGQSYKTDSGYAFILKSGASFYLNNDTSDDNRYKRYYDFQDLEPINQWLLFAGHYEWSTCELISKSDGKVTEIIDYPVISPNKDKIIVAKQDLDAQLEFNGIELLRIDHGKIIHLWIRDLHNIGLSDPQWQDNDTVIFTRENAETHKTDYVKACIGCNQVN